MWKARITDFQAAAWTHGHLMGQPLASISPHDAQVQRRLVHQ
jgi:hypothetical protein